MSIKWPFVSRKKYESLQSRVDNYLSIIQTTTKAQNMIGDMIMLAVEFRAALLAEELEEYRYKEHEDVRI